HRRNSKRVNGVRKHDPQGFCRDGIVWQNNETFNGGSDSVEQLGSVFPVGPRGRGFKVEVLIFSALAFRLLFLPTLPPLSMSLERAMGEIDPLEPVERLKAASDSEIIEPLFLLSVAGDDDGLDDRAAVFQFPHEGVKRTLDLYLLPSV